jgi:hypothetical protein
LFVFRVELLIFYQVVGRPALCLFAADQTLQLFFGQILGPGQLFQELAERSRLGKYRDQSQRGL